MKIFVYERSTLVAVVGMVSTPKVSWRTARRHVRYLSRNDDAEVAADFYQTRNSVGYQSGDFRALPEYARNGLNGTSTYRQWAEQNLT